MVSARAESCRFFREELKMQDKIKKLAGSLPCVLFAAWFSMSLWASEPVYPSNFRVVRVTGDASVACALAEWRSWESEALGCTPSAEVLEELRVRLETALRVAGYVFARVEFPDASWAEGVLTVRVDCGRAGEFTIRRAGRHYTPRQVIAKLSGRSPGFNYAEFCRRLAALNAGDLKVDVTLKPVYRDGRLAVDAEVEYTDHLPIHASLELLNASAPEAKSPVQLRLGMQVLNLAKCDDTLSLHYLTNGDVGGEVNAAYGSYRLPLGEKWVWTAFGSWSDSSYDEIVRGLDLQGRGFSYGLQSEYELYADGRVRATAAFGWRVARTRTRLRLHSQSQALGSATVSMPYVTLGYSEGALDGWGGCDFASLTFSGGHAGWLGASDEDKFRAEGRGSGGDFWQVRASAARLQRLFAGEEHPGCYSLLLRLQGLYTSDAAPNAVREYLGGYENVRGYREAEVSGDSLVAGTLELRTPLLENAAACVTGPRWLPCGRLTAVFFADFGCVRSHDDGNQPANGRRRHQELLSAGAGLRLGLWRNFQAAADYALPLCRHASPDTPRHGRWHLALQLQF